MLVAVVMQTRFGVPASFSPSVTAAPATTHIMMKGCQPSWLVQAGSLTPLTLPGIAYVPWLYLLQVRTFFTMEGGDSEFAKFTVPPLRAV